MKDLIEVFRMVEISEKLRAKIIIKMGNLINHQYSDNITEGVVYELVSILDPENEILEQDRYKKAI